MAQSPAPIRIVAADDHPRMRDGLADLIDSQPDMQMVATVATLADLIVAYRRERPDVTIMDCRLADAAGLEGLRALLGLFPAARIVVLTTYDDEIDGPRARAAGARGFLLKADVRTELLPLIRDVHRAR